MEWGQDQHSCTPYLSDLVKEAQVLPKSSHRTLKTLPIFMIIVKIWQYSTYEIGFFLSRQITGCQAVHWLQAPANENGAISGVISARLIGWWDRSERHC